MNESKKIHVPAISGHEFIHKLGVGQMGCVYLCRQISSGLNVAVKCYAADFTDDATDEAEMMTRLDHPNLVSFLDCGYSNDRFYVIMEYVPWDDLRVRLTAEGRISAALLRVMLRGISSAFTYLHGLGVVHGDLKPENILVNDLGAVKILDFGISAFLSNSIHGMLPDTRPAAGTPAYAAPEVRYRLGHDERSDQYSLAVIVYEMCTGSKPRRSSYCPVSEYDPFLAPEVDRALERALKEDPDERFLSIRTFCEAMDRALGGTRYARRPESTRAMVSCL